MIAIVALTVICLALVLGWIVSLGEQAKLHRAEADTWQKERQQLLDRIQAPTFSEYKQAEVKVIKAQNAQPEPPPLEQL